jgi:copper chaperone NosL
MNKMSRLSRIIIAVGALSLTATYFLPVWFIYLLAPQYPEGLTMNIWLTKLTGDVEIINGLNHYIGMKHISQEMFPEFGYLIYIVGFYILAGLLVALTGRRSLLFVYLLTLVAGGIAGMIDFYSWGYDYGHNLDPTAAIQIPGFAYQPPLIGHKTLLNFEAYSYPEAGGWIFLAASGLFCLVWFFEWRRNRKTTNSMNTTIRNKLLPAAALFLLAFSSCQVAPTPFRYGQDVCDGCQMTIVDPHFGGQIITKKGRTYRFDDALCLLNFLKKGTVKSEDIAQTVQVDYENDQQFLDVKSACFVKSPQLKSPMNGNTVAFASKQHAEAKQRQTGGELKTWQDLQNVQ